MTENIWGHLFNSLCLEALRIQLQVEKSSLPLNERFKNISCIFDLKYKDMHPFS